MLTISKDDLEKMRGTPTDFADLDKFTLDPNVQAEVAGNPRFVGDDKIYVEFYTKPSKSIKKSKAAGRPIFEDTVYIAIMVPGDKLNIVRRPAGQDDMARFTRQFEAFKRGLSQNIGTPLNVLPFLTESEIEEMKHFKIHTVEQLAGMSDSVAQKFITGQSWKQKAKAFLEGTTSNAVLNDKVNAQAAELEALRAQIEALTQKSVATPEQALGSEEVPPQMPRVAAGKPKKAE